MDLKGELRNRASGFGFAAMAVADVQPLDLWRTAADANPRPNWGKITHDARTLMPGARAVVMLAMPYQPFVLEEGPRVDAYYVASNRAYAACKALAEWLESLGHAVLARPSLPYKALCERTGLGQYGRNGLIGAGGLGSRIALTALVTDAALSPDEADAPGEFSGACAHCGACVCACPTGALAGDGRVDMDRCLRAQSDAEPVKEEYRPLLGASMLGCDLCQRACERNACISEVRMPDGLKNALALDALLRGESGQLAEWIGPNNARPGRIQARAALVAGNLGRADLAGMIEPLLASESESAREHAAWALEQFAAARIPE